MFDHKLTIHLGSDHCKEDVRSKWVNNVEAAAREHGASSSDDGRDIVVELHCGPLKLYELEKTFEQIGLKKGAIHDSWVPED